MHISLQNISTIYIDIIKIVPKWKFSNYFDIQPKPRIWYLSKTYNETCFKHGRNPLWVAIAYWKTSYCSMKRNGCFILAIGKVYFVGRIILRIRMFCERHHLTTRIVNQSSTTWKRPNRTKECLFPIDVANILSNT